MAVGPIGSRRAVDSASFANLHLALSGRSLHDQRTHCWGSCHREVSGFGEGAQVANRHAMHDVGFRTGLAIERGSIAPSQPVEECGVGVDATVNSEKHGVLRNILGNRADELCVGGSLLNGLRCHV